MDELLQGRSTQSTAPHEEISPLMRLKYPTWHYEATFVACVLFLSAIVHEEVSGQGFTWLELISGLAVLFSFMHGQVSDRMAESQAKMSTPDVHCYKWSLRYFVTKEILWVTFFILAGSYTAIAGSLVFLAYPVWRRTYRKLQKR